MTELTDISLHDSVRAIVPLFETEVRGVAMLQRLCDAMFAANGAKPAPAEAAGPPVLPRTSAEPARTAM